jgi:hypothetical protein
MPENKFLPAGTLEVETDAHTSLEYEHPTAKCAAISIRFLIT